MDLESLIGSSFSALLIVLLFRIDSRTEHLARAGLRKCIKNINRPCVEFSIINKYWNTR